MINKAFPLVNLVVRGGIEPPAFRFSGAYAPSLHVAGSGLMGDLAGEPWLVVAWCGLMPADIGSPFGSPN
jgi:hypothetical protein